jgi:4-amino-4-deoxy-L-arabinose transferase-like glycosyltransferase
MSGETLQRILSISAVLIGAILLDWILLKVARNRTKKRGSPSSDRIRKVSILGVDSVLLTWVRSERAWRQAQRVNKDKPVHSLPAPVGRAARDQKVDPRILIGLSLVLILIGQALLQNQVNYDDALSQLLVRFHLDLSNLDNSLTGFLVTLFGGVLFAWAAAIQPWLSREEPAPTWPRFANFKIGYYLTRLFLVLALLAILLVPLALHRYAAILPFVWAAVLVILSVLCWRVDRNGKVDLNLHLTRVDKLWILFLLVICLAVASFQLADIPSKMIGDEGSFFENARAVATGQSQPPFFDSGVYTFPITSSLLQGLIMSVAGIGMWGWRFSSVLVGALAVIPVYLIGKDFFDRRVGVVAGIAMAVSPYFLAYARLGYNNSQVFLPIALGVWLCWLAIRRGSYFYGWLAGAVAGLSFYTYSSAQITILIQVTWILFLVLRRSLPWRRFLAIGAVLLAAWAIMGAPRVVYSTSGENPGEMSFKFYESLFANVDYGRAYYSDQELFSYRPAIEINQNQLFIQPEIYALLIGRGITRTMLGFQSPYIVQELFVHSSLVGPLADLFYVLGLWLCVRRWKDSRFAMLLLWFGVGIFALSCLNTFPPRHAHLVGVMPVLALFVGLGVVALVQTVFGLLTRPSERLMRWGQTAALAAVCLGLGLAGTNTYFIQMPKYFGLNFDDFMASISWRAAPGTSIYLVERTPDKHDFNYYVDVKLVQNPYADLSVAQATGAGSPLASPGPKIVFVDKDVFPEVRPNLTKLVAGAGQPMQYFDSDGKTLGYALTNTATPLVAVTDLGPGLANLSRSPAGYLIYLLILCAGLILWLDGTLPAQASRLSAGFKAIRRKNAVERSIISADGKSAGEIVDAHSNGSNHGNGSNGNLDQETMGIEFHFKIVLPTKRGKK